MHSDGNQNDKGNDLKQLTDQLADLGRMFEEANRRIVEHLVERQPRPFPSGDPAPSADSGELSARVAELAEKVERLAEAPTTTAPADAMAMDGGQLSGRFEELVAPIRDKLEVVDQQNTALYQTIEQLRSHFDSGVQSLAELLVPQAQEEETGGVSGDWLTAILGPELSADQALEAPSRKLLEGVLAGNGAAQALAGELLVFRSAPPERLPQMLKDLGEAYYRWNVKTEPGGNPFEEALVAYLKRACENAGISNTIELVHPGERFDAGRHHATSRGVEIVRVLGWIVLRDNGKVYTKATVEVR